MGHCIKLWFDLIIVVAVLLLRVPPKLGIQIALSGLPGDVQFCPARIPNQILYCSDKTAGGRYESR